MSVFFQQKLLSQSPVIKTINVILYDAVMSPSLVYNYIRLASDFSGNFTLILHEADLDIYSNTVAGCGCEKEATTKCSSMPNCPSCKHGK